MEDGFPRQIGRYRVQRELGKGSMGVVYEAHDPALDRTIALKTINLGFALSAEARREFEERFFSEARISGRLSHPGIVAVHDAGRDPDSGLLYMALERLEGRTLAEIKLPLDWRQALRLVRSIAEALDYAHGCRVVHRDIKPANIMRLRNGETKLMDFGIAQIETARIELSGAGQFYGTPLYMAPEVALARKVDGRADLFSLGAVCYALLTGRQAFAADNIPAIVARIAHDDPASPSSVVAEIPAEVDELVEHVLAKEPDRRHPSARAFVEDLEDVLAARRARHSASQRTATFPENTLKLDRKLLLSPPDAGSSPSGAAAAAESPLVALLPETPAPVARLSGRRASRWRVPALSAIFAVGILPFMLPGFAGRLPIPVLREAAPSPSPAAPTSDRTLEADNQTPLASATPPITPLPMPEPTAHRTAEPTAPRTAKAAAPVASPAGPSARLLVDFEHPLKNGRLRLWVNGKIALDELLQGQAAKKLKIIKVREGALENTLKVAPGRHEIEVAVNWDDNEKRDSISGEFREDQAKHLEIRLGRLRKNLSLDWR